MNVQSCSGTNVPSQIYGLVLKRRQILCVRAKAVASGTEETVQSEKESQLWHLPGYGAASGPNPASALKQAFADLGLTVASLSFGGEFSLANGDSAQWFSVLLQISPFDLGPVGVDFCWADLQQASESSAFGAEVRQALQQISVDAGNEYTLAKTSTGTPTFYHPATGEILHGQVGPFKEAWELYVQHGRLLDRVGDTVVYDLGLGAASLPLAACEAFKQNKKIPHMTVVSFDLEQKGVEALLQNLTLFPFAIPYQKLLEDFLTAQEAVLVLDDGRRFEWRFVGGDFCETSKKLEEVPKADIVFLDFFSPKSHPALWCLEVMSRLADACAPDGFVVTYTSATCVKASLAASGFFVGLGPTSGKKSRSILAAKKRELLDSPLPTSWLKTFEASDARYLACETADSQREIWERIHRHPQFQ